MSLKMFFKFKEFPSIVKVVFSIDIGYIYNLERDFS